MQLQKRSKEAESALHSVEDPSIYDYDGHYDDFKIQAVSSHPLSSTNVSTTKEAPVSPSFSFVFFLVVIMIVFEKSQKSQYIGNLLSTAKVREKESERVYEKRLLKERVVEDEQFGEKPKFMTAAYKRKLIEDQKWEYENRYSCVLH